jgi:hypothetical protein
MDNLETLGTMGTQDTGHEDIQNKKHNTEN